MKRPTLHFQNLNAAQLMQYAEQILIKMGQEGDLFATPQPALSDVEDSLAVFRMSAAEAAFNDRRAILLRNTQRRELEGLLYELSKYVDTVAAGDESLVLASGFVPTRSRKSTGGRIPKAANLRVEPEGLGTGNVAVRVDRWEYARMYCFEYRQKGSQEPWQQLLSTRSNAVVEGLTPFEEYEFRATYLGVDPKPNYSDVLSSYAL